MMTWLSLVSDSVLMVIALFIFGAILVCTSKLISAVRVRRVRKHLGLEGEVVYADKGSRTKPMLSKKYGIVAKPDFVVRLLTGEYAVVEYKSRENGRLYESDIAQVKASVLAAREKYPISLAYVISGKRHHKIAISKNSDEIYDEIHYLAEYVRKASKCRLVHVFTAYPAKCGSCASKNECRKP